MIKKDIDKDWLEDQLKLHKSLKEISKIVGCSQDTVKRSAIDYGILHLWSKNGTPTISKESLVEYNNKKLSQGKIAKIYNVSAGHISNLFVKYGIPPFKTNKLNDLTGRTFERWTVIERSENRNNKTYWLCVCSCEKNIKRDVSGADLIAGKSTCCGCIGEEKNAILFKAMSTHGMHGTKLYTKWISMKDRCSNKNNPAYINYGGRGITICDSWLDREKGFINFYNDLSESYYQHCEEYGPRETTIDRIDNDGNYCVENIRWATNLEQNQNKRSVYISDK